jgi:hypothetical protein
MIVEMFEGKDLCSYPGELVQECLERDRPLLRPGGSLIHSHEDGMGTKRLDDREPMRDQAIGQLREGIPPVGEHGRISNDGRKAPGELTPESKWLEKGAFEPAGLKHIALNIVATHCGDSPESAQVFLRTACRERIGVLTDGLRHCGDRSAQSRHVGKQSRDIEDEQCVVSIALLFDTPNVFEGQRPTSQGAVGWFKTHDVYATLAKPGLQTF